jgi:tetratricopeptide (TPR) repeat protein
MKANIDLEKKEKEKQFSETLELLAERIEETPDDVSAYQEVAQCLIQLNQVDKAIKVCQEALAIDQKSPQIHLILASAYNLQKNRSGSRKEIEIALSLDPNSAVVLGYYGISLLMDNEVDEAISNLEKSINLDNSVSDFHYNLAVAYSKKRRFRETIKELKAVYKLRASPKIAFQIALAYGNRFHITGVVGIVFLLALFAAVISGKWGLLIVSLFCLLILLVLDRVIKRSLL